MPTPAYVPLNPDLPSGLTQAPDAYSASDLANVRALRDCIITGALPGWSYSQNPAVSMRPIDRIWASGAFRLKMETAYGGVQNLPTTVKWWWSNDAGATYSQIGATSTLTWDATGTYNLASVDTNAGGWVLWLAAHMASRVGQESITAHAALVGNQAHGLGTMAVQNANAVVITGGTASNVNLDLGTVTQAARVYPKAPLTLVTGVAWNWGGQSGVQYNAAAGIVIPNITNPQPGEVKRIWVGNAGAITINSGGGVTFAWATGHPVWNAAGGTLVCCVAVAANFVLGTTVP